MRYIDLSKTRPQTPLKQVRSKRPQLLVGILLTAIFAMLFSRRYLSLANLIKPVSVFSKIINPQKVASTDGRTNLLLLALDRRETIDSNCGNGKTNGAGLTDTIIVASTNLKKGESVFISIPRDLWVETDYFTGKINSAYSTSAGKAGADLVSRVIGGILGVPIHYYAVVDFAGFEKAIDILGGIEVEVEHSFDDYKYPIPGRECIEPEELRWEHIHFGTGWQLMDGETALKFVRSRHAQGVEGSDFARSRRQQKVLMAARSKFFSLSALSDWSKARELYQTFESSLETNLGLWEIENLYGLAKEIGNIQMEILGDSRNLFYTPEDRKRFGGSWVLIPRSGDFSEVRQYTNELLSESQMP